MGGIVNAIFGGGSSGGGSSTPAPTSQNQTVSNIAPWAQPGVSNLINAASNQIFTDPSQTQLKGYTPFNANTDAGQQWVQGAAGSVAGFSPLQQQAQQNIANMQVPGQYGTAMNASQQAGQGYLDTTGQANGYGQIGQAAGLAGMAAGNAYGQNATDPNAVAAYMNPYIQNTLNPALQLQNQQFGQINAQNQGQATQQGAFGGGRQAVMQGLNQQNQMLAQNQLVGNAYNQAYNTANQNMQTAGSQAMQGAGLGISGAQAGLAGVGAQQAGYGGVGSQATNLANIAGAQTQTGLNINAAQQAAGATQQQNQQNILNQAMANYNTAQTYPMTQLAQLESLYTGAPQNITSSTYSAAPSTVSQLAGLGTAAIGASKLASAKKGGSVKDIKKMAGGGQVAFDIGGSVESSLEAMPDMQLQQVIKTSPSQTMRQEAAKILADRQTENAIAKGVGAAPVNTQMAGGGIVAFAGPDGSLVGSSEDDIVPEDVAAATKKAGSSKAKSFLDALTSASDDSQKDYIQSLMKPGVNYAPVAAAPQVTSPISAAPVAKADALGRFDANNQGNTVSAPVQAPVGGLGATRQAQGPSAPQTTIPGLGANMQYLQDTFGYGKPSQDELDQRAQLKQDRADITKDKDRNKWLALLEGSGAALSSTSPFANVGIGNMISTGTKAYAASEKDLADQLAKVRSGELDLSKLNESERNSLLHYAMTGSVSAQNAAEMAASRRQTGALGQGAREDANIVNLAKVYLAGKPMATEQEQIDAYNLAKKQITGQGAPSASAFSPDAIAAELARRNKQK
jgi:hypothetical protein